jgi:hypothetical protein
MYETILLKLDELSSALVEKPHSRNGHALLELDPDSGRREYTKWFADHLPWRMLFGLREAILEQAPHET